MTGELLYPLNMTRRTADPRLEEKETCNRGLREQLQVLRNPLNQLILLGANFGFSDTHDYPCTGMGVSLQREKKSVIGE